VLTTREVRRLVDFDAPLALLSDVAGEVDPWRLTHALLERCAGRDFALYGRTQALGIVPSRSGLEVHTERGRIRAKHAIVAAGYEAERFLPERVADLHSSFALVTEPVGTLDGWNERCLVWESARPYLYLRTTADDRVLVGGEDIPFRDPARRDARVPDKSAALLDKARRLFPRIEMEPAYGWAGTFGETKHGLAYIGAHPKGDARVHYALGYGGNGITYSAIAAEMLAAAVLGEAHRYRDTFSFDR
jgi:glycine/D-amino acid oxidase-like deaminating enzyme